MLSCPYVQTVSSPQMIVVISKNHINLKYHTLEQRCLVIVPLSDFWHFRATFWRKKSLSNEVKWILLTRLSCWQNKRPLITAHLVREICCDASKQVSNRETVKTTVIHPSIHPSMTSSVEGIEASDAQLPPFTPTRWLNTFALIATFYPAWFRKTHPDQVLHLFEAIGSKAIALPHCSVNDEACSAIALAIANSKTLESVSRFEL